MLPVRPELVGQEPYGAPQLDVPVRLNVNENPFPLPPVVVDAVTEATRGLASGLNRYPERDAVDLRRRLAGYLGHGLDERHIWAANGSNEVMTHLLQAFAGPGRRVLTFTPTYSMYPEYARNTWSDYVTLPRCEDFSIDLDAFEAAVGQEMPHVVIVTTPNNPTGTATPLEVIARILEITEHGEASAMVIVDEAYQEFARPGTASALDLLEDNPRLVVTRTMSKAFGFAGGRLGYLAAAPEVVDVCRVVRLPYHLSAVTQAVASAAVDHADVLMGQVAELRAQRDRMETELRGMGLEVAESDANFVLFGRFEDRHAVWADLLERGVLIREVGPPGWLRASAGTPEETDAFLRAMSEIVPDAVLMDTAVMTDEAAAQVNRSNA